MTAARRTDVVVVGGGPAGLAAADAAAAAGRQVLLLDQGARLGGQIWRHRPGDPLSATARAALAAVAPPRVSVAHRATVVDALSPHRLVVSFNGRIAVVDAGVVILATGATERFLPFPGWTLPGVVGVGGLQALVKSGLSLAGARVILAGSGPLLLPVAATLAAHDAQVLLLAEQADGGAVRRFARRALASPARLWQAVALRWASRGAPYRTDSWVLAAEGRDRVERVTMRIGARDEVFACDWLGTNAGLVPRTDLAELLGCQVGEGGIVVDEHQATSVPGVYAAGECCGIKGDLGAMLEGRIAGIAASGAGAMPRRLLRRRARARAFGRLLGHTFAPRRALRDRVTAETIVCRCEDVTRGMLDPSWDQRQAKLWTRIGMGACQGAVCGATCQALFGFHRNAVRPPLEQPPLGAWAAAIGSVTPEAVATHPPTHPPGG